MLGSLAETLVRPLPRKPVTPLQVVLLIASDDRRVVEADLASGRSVCPHCRAGCGELGPDLFETEAPQSRQAPRRLPT